MNSQLVGLLMLVCLGLSSCVAIPRPTSSGEAPENQYKKAANMLLKTSESVQEWGNHVLDASNTGFTADVMTELRGSLTSVMELTNTNLEPYLVMLAAMTSDSVDTPKQSPQDIADEATAMLKEGVVKVVLKEDDMLLLVAGDAQSSGTTRLRLNVRLFERIMQRLEDTLEDLIDLTSVGNEQDIKDEFLDFVSEIASESTGLSMVFSGLEASFQETIKPRRQRRSVASDCRVMVKQQ